MQTSRVLDGLTTGGYMTSLHWPYGKACKCCSGGSTKHPKKTVLVYPTSIVILNPAVLIVAVAFFLISSSLLGDG